MFKARVLVTFSSISNFKNEQNEEKIEYDATNIYLNRYFILTFLENNISVAFESIIYSAFLLSGISDRSSDRLKKDLKLNAEAWSMQLRRNVFETSCV